MSDDEASSERSAPRPIPVWQALLVGAATLSTAGMLEWLLRRPQTPLEVGALALGSVILVHASVGAFGGLLARMSRRTRDSVSGIAAGALSMWIPAAVYLGGHGLRGALVGLAAAFALLPILHRVVGWLRLDATRVGLLHGLVLAAGVAAVALRSAEDRTATLAVGLAVLALLGLVRWRAIWPTIAGGAGLAALILGGLPAADIEAVPPDGAPSVLLFTLDTLRADRLGFDGFAAAETPAMDALAAEGVWFSNAQSLSSWTGPSHLTILTGRTPSNHGVLRNARKLPESIPTLGHLLSERGWHTGAFVAGFPLQVRAIGLRDAFHHYDDRFEPPGVGAFGSTLAKGLRDLRRRGQPRSWRRNGEDVNAALLPWLARERDRPFFAWVHYYDPHLPYEQGELPDGEVGWDYALPLAEKQAIVASPERMARMKTHYDEQVTYTDRQVGQVVERAREASDGNLWIVLTADHGESFGEHGLFFHRDAYEVTGRVPLIVVPPKGTSIGRGRDSRLVGSHDIAPTLLRALGLELPEGVDGVDILAEDALDPERVVVKQHEPEEPAKYQRSMSVRGDRFRLVHREPGFKGRELAPGGVELYDLESDPAETRNLVGTGLAEEARLRRELPRAEGDGTGDEALDEETREALRALGYLD